MDYYAKIIEATRDAEYRSTYHCFAPRCRFETADRQAYADHTRTAHGEPPLEGITDTDCVFHGQVYPEHDFTYGNECRRCGAEADDD